MIQSPPVICNVQKSSICAEVSVFHCFSTEQAGKDFIEEWNSRGSRRIAYLFCVQSHTNHIIAAGVTPAVTVFNNAQIGVEYPTIVVSSLTIAPEEFSRVQQLAQGKKSCA